MMKFVAAHNNLRGIRADLVVLAVFEDRDLYTTQCTQLADLLGETAAPLKTSQFSGKARETLLLYPRNLRARQLLLVGAGKAADLTLEYLRRLSASAAKTARELRARSVAILEPSPLALTRAKIETQRNVWQSIGSALVEGAALALYRYDKYKAPDPAQPEVVRHITIVGQTADRARALAEGVRVANIVVKATMLARDLANAPGNEIYPASLARRAQAIGREAGFGVTVFHQARVRQLGMGGLNAVGQGSDNPPCFIVMEHNRRMASRGTIVLVGKGVTFDSGGISIKPAANMAEMKMDMAGGAAVIGTMQAAARLRIGFHIVGLIPATENLPSGKALKPGDILTHYGGTTSEVDNTDAEGRLILADALAYARRYKPDLIIDLATLTGAIVVALGHHATGMFGNDRSAMDQLKASGDRTFERVWELPLYQEYEPLIKSDVADAKNTGGRWAGAITGALFLRKFIGECRWVHLDIAGTATLEEPLEYIPRGGSGVGVRLLVDFLQHWRKN